MYIIYGVKGCGYCIKAVELLQRLEREHQYIDITNNQEKRAEFRALGYRTVPQIYRVVNDVETYIGGHDDLVKSLNT